MLPDNLFPRNLKFIRDFISHNAYWYQKTQLKQFFYRSDSNTSKILLTTFSKFFINKTFPLFQFFIHFKQLVSFFTPSKRPIASGFLIFSERMERQQWHEMSLTLSRRRPLSYRNQPIDLQGRVKQELLSQIKIISFI